MEGESLSYDSLHEEDDTLCLERQYDEGFVKSCSLYETAIKVSPQAAAQPAPPEPKGARGEGKEVMAHIAKGLRKQEIEVADVKEASAIEMMKLARARTLPPSRRSTRPTTF